MTLVDRRDHKNGRSNLRFKCRCGATHRSICDTTRIDIEVLSVISGHGPICKDAGDGE